jgi:hypothetical protein
MVAKAELTLSGCYNFLLFTLCNVKHQIRKQYIYIRFQYIEFNFDWNTHVSSCETLDQENYNVVIYF